MSIAGGGHSSAAGDHHDVSDVAVLPRFRRGRVRAIGLVAGDLEDAGTPESNAAMMIVVGRAGSVANSVPRWDAPGGATGRCLRSTTAADTGPGLSTRPHPGRRRAGETATWGFDPPGAAGVLPLHTHASAFPSLVAGLVNDEHRVRRA